MSELTWRQVIARRLARSHLLDPALRTRLVDVVRDVGLIQAQVLSAAEIGLCLRVDGITAADVRRELYQRRSLVKTWSLRGTLHLVPADELGFWAAAARGPEPFWEAREWLAKHDLTRRRAGALFDAIADALDGRCLTRAELADAAGDDRLLSGWGELLGPLAFQGRLCFGEPRGANVTFVRADQWIGGWAEVDPADARREVLRRYLRAYGPAKPADFQRWSGFGGDAARALFDELAAELEQVRVEGTRTWLLKDDLGGFDREARMIRLLPQYDAYVIGFRPREPILPDPVEVHIKLDPKGRFESVTGMSPLVVDGVVTGFWRRAKGQIEIKHVVRVPRGRKRELQAGVARVQEALS
ncbi:MAG TPA: winged helix DNA-binding domain-containing protein [Gaiellaceae bacterium]